jgi:hypothetical protein
MQTYLVPRVAMVACVTMLARCQAADGPAPPTAAKPDGPVQITATPATVMSCSRDDRPVSSCFTCQTTGGRSMRAKAEDSR